ncbi:MAG: HlyC/CorC family transporter [Lachnospiraceae bacterium]|nr:HlyC/CorC family transporter [Lachnospiraceae bacterium]
MDAGPRLLILIILLLLSAFFSSAETAFTVVNQIQLQLLADDGNKKAKRALWILEHKTKMLSAVLIGNNIVNISATALATKLTIDILGNVWVGVVTGILTVAVLIFGEIVPKSLATVFSLQLSQAYSLSIRVIMWLLTPFIKIVEVVRSGVFNIMGVDAAKKLNAMTEDELKSLVDVGLEEGAIEDDEFKMITNVFSLDDSLAKDIMIPRIDMVYVPLDADKDEVLSIYREYNYTRYPVFNDDKDTVIGTINVKDILSLEDDDPFHVGQIMREPHFTFEHKEVGTLLIEMRQEALSIIYVLDEYGSISGMVTLEDILEEIVGEIRDEFDHDEKDPIIKLKGEGEYLIDGTTNLDDVNETLGLSLNSEEYDSIAGYILEYLDRLPKSGEEIILEDGTRIVAVLVRRNRIEKVHLFMNNQDPSSLRSSG